MIISIGKICDLVCVRLRHDLAFSYMTNEQKTSKHITRSCIRDPAGDLTLPVSRQDGRICGIYTIGIPGKQS